MLVTPYKTQEEIKIEHFSQQFITVVVSKEITAFTPVGHVFTGVCIYIMVIWYCPHQLTFLINKYYTGVCNICSTFSISEFITICK